MSSDTRFSSGVSSYVHGRAVVDVYFIKGRLKFGVAKNNAPFPSMILIFKGE